MLSIIKVKHVVVFLLGFCFHAAVSYANTDSAFDTTEDGLDAPPHESGHSWPDDADPENILGELIADSPVAYGTTAASVLSIQALTFTGLNQSDYPFAESIFALRYCSDFCTLVAPVLLPTGARVATLVLDADDQDNLGNIVVRFGSCPKLDVACDVEAMVETGAAATPGANLYSVNLDHTIDNSASAYLAEVQLTGGTEGTAFGSVNILWYRQISPAPGTPTFGDVPTSHQFFQEIEALVGANITSGCGAGNYCPDQAVTRGQMAVFLSRALGLHWPNS